ncbi:MAG: hemerythrin domain-containing protein [Acidobacteriaceae bacterium]
MAVQIGARPDSGSDDPIGMLQDCHRRIEHFLGIFLRVAEDARGRLLTPEEQAAIQAALHYFRTSGPLHNADEEQSLFPRIRNGADLDVLGHVEKLEAQHREAACLHGTIGHLFSVWTSNGTLPKKDGAALLSAIETLQHLYTRHIQVEETIVFPYAKGRLDAAAIREFGAEFRSRRK